MSYTRMKKHDAWSRRFAGEDTGVNIDITAGSRKVIGFPCFYIHPAPFNSHCYNHSYRRYVGDHDQHHWPSPWHPDRTMQHPFRDHPFTMVEKINFKKEGYSKTVKVFLGDGGVNDTDLYVKATIEDHAIRMVVDATKLVGIEEEFIVPYTMFAVCGDDVDNVTNGCICVHPSLFGKRPMEFEDELS